MPMLERLSNLGYVSIRKQTTPLAVAGTPNVYLPVYSESLTSNANFARSNPILGNKFRNYQTLRGNRAHTGEMVFLGEPNTCSYLFDMFMTKGTSTGTDPKTHPFVFSAVTDPNFYTVDISYVSHVVRFVGVGAHDITPEWEDGEMRLTAAVSAHKAWAGREIASVSGTGPSTIVFKTDYETNPSAALVVGDILQVFDVSAGNYINCTVASIVNATSITVTENITPAAAGDYVTIRPGTPSYSLLPPFLWGNTEFRFGATAAAALTATHTPLEEDSGWHLIHGFENDEGNHRSGSFDPAALPRMQGGYEFTARKYFDTPEEEINYNAMTKRACVARHFSYSGGNTYELRITMNNMTAGNPQPSLETESVLYSEIAFGDNYDPTDAQGMDVKVLSAVATV